MNSGYQQSSSLFTSGNSGGGVAPGSGTKGTDGLIISALIAYLVVALNSRRWGYKMALLGTMPIAVMTACNAGVFRRIPINNLLVPLTATTVLFSLYLVIDKKSKTAFERPLEPEHKNRAIMLYIGYLVLFNIIFIASDRML